MSVTRAVDILSLVLLATAGGVFFLGVVALDHEHDLHSLYLLAVGGLLLRAAVDMLRPKGGR